MAWRAIVWKALNNPEILAANLQGCEEMRKVSDDAFTPKVKAKIGPVSATSSADLMLSDKREPEAQLSFSLQVHCRGQFLVSGPQDTTLRGWYRY